METINELKNVELYTEENSQGIIEYFLNVTYLKHGDRNVMEVNYPKVKLPLCSGINHQPIVEYQYSVSYINFGFGFLPLLEGGPNNTIMTAKCVKTFPRKMTLAEIEEKLGYKVELVSEKEEKAND